MESQATANSDEDVSWVSVWSYVTLWVSNKSGFWWRHLLSPSLELCDLRVWDKREFFWRYLLSLSFELFKFMSLKQNRSLKMTFVESQFRVMWVYEFQTKGNYCEDICSVSAWSYVTFGVSSNSEFLWRHLLSLSLEWCKFMNFKQKRILMKAFVESQFEVIQVYEF